MSMSKEDIIQALENFQILFEINHTIRNDLRDQVQKLEKRLSKLEDATVYRGKR